MHCGDLGETPCPAHGCDYGLASLDGTCQPCGQLTRPVCPYGCATCAANGCVPPGLVNNGTCQLCAGINFSPITATTPAYLTSTVLPPAPNTTPITTTGPNAPPITFTYQLSQDVPATLTVQGSDGSTSRLAGTGRFQTVTFANAQLSAPIPAPSITYTATVSISGTSNCPTSAPVTVVMPPRDAQGPAGNCTHRPIQFGNNGSGPTPGPVTIVPILWGWGDPPYAAKLDAIYGQILSSHYYQWIQAEYGAPSLHIYPTVATQPPAHMSNNILDSDLEDDLNHMVYSGIVPDVGSHGISHALYMIHLPPNVVARESDGKTICVAVLAWNTQTILDNLIWGGHRQYAVLPDPSNCGSNGGIDNLTISITHELIENVTDPGKGDGWEDINQPAPCGRQIGDLCNRQGQVIQDFGTKLMVQKMWSNRMGACVTENALNVSLN